MFKSTSPTSDSYKFNSKYVRWVVSTVTAISNGFENVYYPMHPCTEEEFSEFTHDPNAFETVNLLKK